MLIRQAWVTCPALGGYGWWEGMQGVRSWQTWGPEHRRRWVPKGRPGVVTRNRELGSWPALRTGTHQMPGEKNRTQDEQPLVMNRESETCSSHCLQNAEQTFALLEFFLRTSVAVCIPGVQTEKKVKMRHLLWCALGITLVEGQEGTQERQRERAAQPPPHPHGGSGARTASQRVPQGAEPPGF